MASLDRNLRRDLENAVKKARRAAEAGARQAVEQLAVGHHEPWAALSPDQRKLRNRLRAHGRQLGDKLDEKKGTQSIDRLTGECAYEHWHRLLFARFLAENDLLVEPGSGMSLSLDECRELARERGIDWLVLASEFAQRMLPQIFRAGDPVLEVALPPETRQQLEAILEALPRDVLISDDSLGWVYQFWQSEQKDAVNASEDKIGADELPAVTQLFTEDYMVLFLLHNTLGAWWAGKVLAAKPDLARCTASENELRTACAVQGIEWSYLRFVREGDVWRPAAGTFPGWATAAKNLTVLDPCMGSGHFLAFALPMLVAIRRKEENLSVAEAVDAVLRDNLFGLELDPRCTQIAAFNVGITAWKLAGYRPLPALNLACAGLAINAPVATWTALAAGDTLAENAMRQLYELFRQAPTLGSLIDPTRVGGDLFGANFDKVRGLLSSALATEESEDAELAVVAQGIAKSGQILAGQFTLVATNVPYLGRQKQDSVLQQCCELSFPEAKADLATCLILRCLAFCATGGSVALLTPQNWMFLRTYQAMRRTLLDSVQWDFVARLGPKGFQTPMWDFNTVLFGLSRRRPGPNQVFAGADVGEEVTPEAKANALRAAEMELHSQSSQLKNPDARIVLAASSDLNLLQKYASAYLGLHVGDWERFRRGFWEVANLGRDWRTLQNAFTAVAPYAGLDDIIFWPNEGQGHRDNPAARVQGGPAWGRKGVAISMMAKLPATLYDGGLFRNGVAVVSPIDAKNLPAIWAFCSSPDFNEEVRKVDQKLYVTCSTLVKIPFDLEHWRKVAADRYPHGLPKPFSYDPSQWLFSGHPVGAVQPLQVVVARLLGYQWPRQTGSSFLDCPVLGSDGLEALADDDGIVCLPSLRGEAPAAERVRALLAGTVGSEWSAHKLNELLANVDFSGKSLEDWCRDGFFEQHCALFQQRPFVWQIWDGRKDGFSALVNYHQLAAPNGEGRRILDKLTHTYLGRDWLDRQRADQRAGVEGSDGRVAAAEHLKRQLEKILEGEPPYDIFVRWKPLHQQPVGWDPDINDGVRVNIRPFMTAKPLNARGKNACILRVAPKIKWEKDRGKEPQRAKADFPWFWGWDESAKDFAGGKEFDGNRWNDLHYSSAVKLAARERAKGDKS